MRGTGRGCTINGIRSCINRRLSINIGAVAQNRSRIGNNLNARIGGEEIVVSDGSGRRRRRRVGLRKILGMGEIRTGVAVCACCCPVGIDHAREILIAELC